MTIIDFTLILPELFLLITVNILLLYALFFAGLGQSNQRFSISPIIKKSQKTKNGDYVATAITPESLIRSAYLSTPLQIVEPLSWLIVLSLVFSTLLILNNPVTNAVILTNSFICDDYATLFKVLLCLASGAAIALAIPSKKGFMVGSCYATRSSYEFVLIILLAILGMLCLISSYNFLTLYLSIELQSLSFYLLACSKARSEFSAEAGLKYFILGAFSSAILLFGISIIYGSIGSIYFDDVTALLNYSDNSINLGSGLNSLISVNKAVATYTNAPYIGLGIGLTCICISLLFKLAAVPFHMWAPDVYEGSPMDITAFFAISAKIAALNLLARFVIATEQLLVPILSFVAMATLTVGTLSAMRQVKIKRLIAFSGISNVGWFIMGLCCGGLDAVILHLIVYVILSITLFSILIIPIHRLQGSYFTTTVGNTTIKHISDLGQVYKTNTIVALALTITFFSLGGIPVLAGFYSKYLIINAAIQAEALALIIIGLLSAVFSAYYYIRVVKTVYFSENGSDWFSFSVPTSTNAYLIGITCFFTLLFIVYPESINIWLINASL
uniref:NADH dehydrogenase subunit 2 n=1 Tax=Gayralia brasiliensis TaxID=1286870 RepID=UPI002410E3E1|nr:NADH dehydrogenase subunit 2 [Gayralia brasiliensis]YP_010733834.1 NADH dehydrogenase subunit 2 [Monostroma nitidum]WEG93076.1 NADH dehydrogenase subunit 2 [Gayralia brasiliensis]WEG93105.1 NADH dehydrogenase subunit 2 [Monostroma nitidum]